MRTSPIDPSTPLTTETSPDCDEFVSASGDFDVSSIGGYPVRKVVIVAGTGTLKFQTRTSKTAASPSFRTMSAAAKNDVLEAEIWNLGGTGNGTSAGLTIRVFK